MKLKSFRIRNYRAIVDTGWINLSPDNITTLIGQNESGKTSVLEALYSFYTGSVHEDILRSDLSLPYISCSFSLNKAMLLNMLNPEFLNPEVYDGILSSGLIHLNRKWIDPNKSLLFFGDEQLIATYEKSKVKEEQMIAELEESVHLILGETSRLSAESVQILNEKKNLEKSLASLRKREVNLNRTIHRAKGNRKEQAEKEQNILAIEINQAEVKFNSINENLNTIQIRLNELQRASKYAGFFLESGRRYQSIKESLIILHDDIQKRDIELKFCTNEKRSHTLKSEIRDLDSLIRQRTEEMKLANDSFQFYTDCLSFALSDSKMEEIEDRVISNHQENQKILTSEDLGQQLFKHIPVFKLFEDFSSLLPNRIDLDDILSSNTSVEGFNAVKNFLIVSGLDATFFTEQNSRILKQKIENLNGELTLHFQDYWRQNVGRNNKIKINFELEHYDFSHPTKKGKPYLEFWIKDEHERLYPKQRSRGVRWFLSFYLELKATSTAKKSVSTILLIDEPGLSLHTRAQEDVLKVFEDMKENIQVVYSTHSPHLVDVSKLYRILAVQRADEYNDKSESLIFDTQKLGLASGDTLSPVYSLIGTRLSESSFLQERNNLIVEDSYVYYYLNNFIKIFGKDENIYFLPANGAANIPTMVNLMIGWNLSFAVLLSDNQSGKIVYKELKEKMFRGEVEGFSRKVIIMENTPGIEELFSIIDFKKHVLQQRIGITESILEFIENNNLSRIDLATSFSLRCHQNKLSRSDFDEDTSTNISNLIKTIMKGLAS